MATRIEWDAAGWDRLVKETVDKVAVPACERIAEACNKDLEERGHPTHEEGNEPGYIVSVDGGKPLQKHDYHATVITKTNEAMVDNAEHNTLIMNVQKGVQ